MPAKGTVLYLGGVPNAESALSNHPVSSAATKEKAWPFESIKRTFGSSGISTDRVTESNEV